MPEVKCVSEAIVIVQVAIMIAMFLESSASMYSLVFSYRIELQNWYFSTVHEIYYEYFISWKGFI